MRKLFCKASAILLAIIISMATFAPTFEASAYGMENDWLYEEVVDIDVPEADGADKEAVLNAVENFTYENIYGLTTSGALSHGRIFGGRGTTFAIMPDGSLWGWGANAQGQLGVGTNTANYPNPIFIMDDVISVATDTWTSFAIRSDGSLYGWGANWWGNVGDGTTTHRTSPVRVLDNVVQVSAGQEHTLALRADGSVWAWGNNFAGMIGDGTTTRRLFPVRVNDLGNNVTYISAGIAHSMAIRSDGSLWGWGDNEWAQLGDGTTTRRLRPVRILNDVAAVSGSAAIRTDGSLWTWGWNHLGQVGDGTTINRLRPVWIMNNVTSVVFRHDHGAALTADGNLWAWGISNISQRGNLSRPVLVMNDVVEFAAGPGNATVIRSDGNVWRWGGNPFVNIGSPVLVIEDIIP